MTEPQLPATIELGDRRYRATVLRVVKSDEKGPRVFELLRDDESIEVQDGMQFWIIYANEDVLKKVN